jgi:glycerol-3-phosphate acyltransferase PlsY
MNVFLLSVGVIAAYLIGAIPTSILYGRLKFGLDIREHGSGNAGATNTFRVLGKKAGSLVMAVDIFKGFLATCIPFLFLYFDVIADGYQLVIWQIVCGIAAVVGHIFPVYERFKGGKGVASLLGMVLSLHTPAALVCIAIFLIVFLISKYVSLGSMLATLAFPIYFILSNPDQEPSHKVLTIFGFILFVLVAYTHKTNIKRLMRGEENKANIKLRKSKD